MTKMFLIAACTGLLLFGSIAWAGEKKMTMEQYQEEMSSAMQREKSAKEALAEEQVAVENLNLQIQETDQKIAATIQESFYMLNITETDVQAMENGIAESKMEFNSLIELPAEEYVLGKQRITNARSRLAGLRAKPAAKLNRFATNFVELDGLSAQLDEKMNTSVEEVKQAKIAAKEAEKAAKAEAKAQAKAAREAKRAGKASPPAAEPAETYAGSAEPYSGSSEGYTVRPYSESKDCLWNIAQKTYGDYFKWEVIYKANQDKIKDPDKIFPGQVISIPK